MAINLYVTSTQNFSGKSAICVTLMRRLRQDGYQVGYFKPFSSAARVMAESSIDEDARFFKETFDLKEAVDTLAPVIITEQQLKQILSQDQADYRDAVKEAAQIIGQDKDIVLVEGSDNFREGRIVQLAPSEVVNLVEAKVITIVGYQDSLQVVDDILTAQARIRERLLGVIINAVPDSRADYVNNLVKPYVQRQGIRVWAILPYQKILRSVSVGEMVQYLGGELICCASSDELVENLMVAAMNVEQALTHFRQLTNKAVIVGGDRPDIQLAAMETSTKALILTGGTRPNPMVEARAEERGVAIILSPYDTLTTVERVEQFFGKTRFHQTEKIERFEQLLNENLDFTEFYRAIGLGKK
jgi:BioD-like phosphotransacetylase family protein